MSSMMSSKLIASPSYMVFGLIKHLRPFVCRPTERRSRFSVCLLNNYANKAICRHEMLFFLPSLIFRPLASHIFHIHSMPFSLTFHANPSLDSLPATDDDFIIQLHFALIFDSAVCEECGVEWENVRAFFTGKRESYQKKIYYNRNFPQLSRVSTCSECNVNNV